MQILQTRSLGYDDVNLIAQPGVVNSRSEIPIEGHRIVVSAMTSIVGPHFIDAVNKLPLELQPTIHIPRDVYAEANIYQARTRGLTHIFVGVGLNTENLEIAAKQNGYDTLLLDVANGYLPSVIDKVKDLKEKGFKVIVGSVHTKEGVKNLIEAGADVVRSGIGPGSVCITKDSTGFTRGTISEIQELASTKKILHVNINFDASIETSSYTDAEHKILADGGLRSPSDAAKAFFAGADYIMTGRMFVDAAEARLRVDGSNIYYGMASALGKAAMGKKVENVEGKLDTLPTDQVKPLQEILETIWAGIRSAVSYSGYPTLEAAIGNGIFEVKQQR